MIVDFHTHTVSSDGVLIPAESARRAKAAGYSGIAITDHADYSNYEQCLGAALRFKKQYNCSDDSFAVLAGVEITHVRPKDIAELVRRLHLLKADIILVHGETMTEPLEEGTNIAAIEAGVDILAHPGLISEADAKAAAARGVRLEITTRRGHAYGNGNTVRMAKLTGAKLIINNDFHAPGDYVGESFATKVLMGAGMTYAEAVAVIADSVAFFEQKLGRKL